MPWYFSILHLPGKTNFAANAISRHQSPPINTSEKPADVVSEVSIAAAIRSDTYKARSNGQVEVAVKSAKRLLRSNTSLSGTLDTDRFLRCSFGNT